MMYEFNLEITKSFYVRYVKERYGLHKLIYKIGLVLYVLVLYLTCLFIEIECFWITLVIICILIYKLILGSRLHALWEYTRFIKIYKNKNIIQRTFYEDYIESSVNEKKVIIYYNKINKYIDSGKFLTLFTSKEKIIIEKESITDYQNFIYFLDSRISVENTKVYKEGKLKKINRVIKAIIIIFGAIILLYVTFINMVSKLIRYEIDQIEDHGIEVYLDDCSYERFEKYDILRWLNLSRAFTFSCDAVEVLDSTPDGLFEEIMSTKTCSNGIELHLFSHRTVSKLGHKISGFELGRTELNTNQDDKVRIYLNVRAAYVKLNFVHELYHVMENYMEKVDDTDGIIKEYSFWEKLNPDKFEYYETRFDANGNYYGLDNEGKYIPKKEIDLNNIYFVNNYSKTFEKEDRAEIFSYLLATDKKESLPDYYESKHIQEKAEVICKALRNHFKCLKGKEAYWEQKLHD